MSILSAIGSELILSVSAPLASVDWGAELKLMYDADPLDVKDEESFSDFPSSFGRLLRFLGRFRLNPCPSYCASLHLVPGGDDCCILGQVPEAVAVGFLFCPLLCPRRRVVSLSSDLHWRSSIDSIRSTCHRSKLSGRHDTTDRWDLLVGSSSGSSIA